jgi:hypothetical protein
MFDKTFFNELKKYYWTAWIPICAGFIILASAIIYSVITILKSIFGG